MYSKMKALNLAAFVSYRFNVIKMEIFMEKYYALFQEDAILSGGLKTLCCYMKYLLLYEVVIS